MNNGKHQREQLLFAVQWQLDVWKIKLIRQLVERFWSPFVMKLPKTELVSRIHPTQVMHSDV